MATAGKKERRSRRDRARARRTKLGPGKRKKPKSIDQQAIEKALHKERKEMGQAGLAGAGRGTVIPSKKQKSLRPYRKRKHKGQHRASAERVASAYLARSSP